MEISEEGKRRANKITELMSINASNAEIKKELKLSRFWMFDSDENARALLPALTELSEKNQSLGLAELLLALCYSMGKGVAKNPAQAVHYIRRGVALKHTDSLYFYAEWLTGETELAEALPPDPAEALQIFRTLAVGSDISLASLSSRSAILMLIEGRTAKDCTQDELDEIYRYRQNTDWSDFNYQLARFYSDHLNSRNYGGPEYYEARKLLLADLRPNSRSRAASEALLAKWEALPDPEVDYSLSNAPLAAKATIVAIPFILIFWSFAGLGLLALITFIQPFLLILVAIFFVGMFFFSKRAK